MEDSDWTIPEDVKTELIKKAEELSVICLNNKIPAVFFSQYGGSDVHANYVSFRSAPDKNTSLKMKIMGSVHALLFGFGPDVDTNQSTDNELLELASFLIDMEQRIVDREEKKNG